MSPLHGTLRGTLLGALVGLVALGGLVVLRADPEWKSHQRTWRAQRVAMLEARLATARTDAADAIAQAEQALADADLAIDPRSVAELEREIHGLERQRRRAARDRARAEATEDLEEARIRRIEVESLDEMIAERRGRLDAILVGRREATDQLGAARQPIETLEAALDDARPSWLAKVPVLRRLDPSLEIVTVGADGERCATCHVGLLEPADAESQASSESIPWVAVPHPRADLIGPGTAHPFEAVGCTVCHGGDGDALSFDGSGHRGDDPATTREHTPRSTPSIAGGAVAEAGCVTCHGGDVWIDHAPTQHAGLRVAASLGCAGCHTTGRPVLDDASPAGPSLVDLAERAPRDWVASTLRAPRSQRPGAWMPALWADADEATRETEIAAVVAWLWQGDGSKDAEEPKPIDLGDPVTGRRLLAERGCLACHLGPGESVDAGDGAPSTSLERRRGPHLGSVAHLDPSWLVRWLLDPASVHPDTPMPSLRLEQDEAEAIAAALLEPSASGTSEPEASADDASADDATLEALLRAALLERTTVEQSEALLAGADADERLVALGRHVAASRGCAGCHHLPELAPSSEIEAALASDPAADGAIAIQPPAAPSLASIGERFDPPSASTAADAPSRSWLDALHPRLGRFALTPSLETALEAQLRGWRPPPPSHGPSSTSAAVEPGRAVMERLGCRACHTATTRATDPHRILAWPDAPSVDLPPLDLAGRKLRAPWLVDYLAAPERVTLRPWTPLRMPSYRYADGGLDAIARALAATAGVPLLEPAPATDPGRRAVGDVLFGVLFCDSCHLGGDSPASGPPAPLYTGAGERLRHRFVVEWLLAPHRLDPHTAMPQIFAPDATGRPDASFLAGTLDAPLFSVQQARLQRLFASEADYRATITDAEEVAQALADYLATLD